MHARFNFVNALQISTDRNLKKDFLNTRRNDKFGGSLDKKSTTFLTQRPKVDVHKPNEAFFYKKLSKNIDLLQSKYGMPSLYKGKLLVASCNEFYVETAPHTAESVNSQHTMGRKFLHRGFVAMGPPPRMLRGPQVTKNVLNFKIKCGRSESRFLTFAL